MFCRRRAFVRHHGLDFAPQALGIEFERCFTLTAEVQIRNQLHAVFLIF